MVEKIVVMTVERMQPREQAGEMSSQPLHIRIPLSRVGTPLEARFQSRHQPPQRRSTLALHPSGVLYFSHLITFVHA